MRYRFVFELSLEKRSDPERSKNESTELTDLCVNLMTKWPLVETVIMTNVPE